MFIESQTVELKREIGDMQGPIKTACAFANTHGGKIFFGVDDKGIAVGIPTDELDRTQQRMMQGMRQLSPVPFYEIDVLEENGVNIVQLEVEPMMYGTICSYQGVIYYRHGSVTERAEGPTLQELLVRRKVVDFELSISRSALEDLDAEAVCSVETIVFY